MTIRPSRRSRHVYVSAQREREREPVRGSDLRIATFVPSTVLVQQQQQQKTPRPRVFRRPRGAARGLAAASSLDEFIAHADITSLLGACRTAPGEDVEARIVAQAEREGRALRSSNLVVAGYLIQSNKLAGYARASGDRAFVCCVDRCVLSPAYAFADDVMPALLRRLGEEADACFGIIDIAYGMRETVPDTSGFYPDVLGSRRLRWAGRP